MSSSAFLRYAAIPPLRERYTREEEQLRRIVLTEEFVSRLGRVWRGRQPPPDLESLQSLFEAYTTKLFPLSVVDPKHFVDFVTRNYKHRAPTQIAPANMAWWTKDPRGKQFMPSPSIEHRDPRTIEFSLRP